MDTQKEFEHRKEQEQRSKAFEAIMNEPDVKEDIGLLRAYITNNCTSFYQLTLQNAFEFICSLKNKKYTVAYWYFFVYSDLMQKIVGYEHECGAFRGPDHVRFKIGDFFVHQRNTDGKNRITTARKFFDAMRVGKDTSFKL